jgi:lysozyme
MRFTAFDILEKEEGFRAQAYPDRKGWSTGYGHHIQNYEEYLIKATISTEVASTLLKEDVSFFERLVDKTVTCALTQNQYNALILLVYNVGFWGALKSSLFKAIEDKKTATIKEIWLSLDKGSPVIRARRQREIDMFFGGTE